PASWRRRRRSRDQGARPVQALGPGRPQAPPATRCRRRGGRRPRPYPRQRRRDPGQGQPLARVGRSPPNRDARRRRLGSLGSRAERSGETEEWCAVLALRRRHDLTDEEGVRARCELVDESALEPAERALEERRPELTLARRNALPHPDRRDAAGEVLRERLLLGAEQRRSERSSLAQELVERRL